MTFLPHLLRPTRAAAAAVIVVFSVILSIALHGGLHPHVVVLQIRVHPVRSHGVGPRGAADSRHQMLNPLDEQRPLAQVLILGSIYAAVKFIEGTWDAGPAAVLAALGALAFPASVAVMGLERDFLSAIYPVEITRMIRSLGVMYLLVLAVIGVCIAGIGMLLKWVSMLPLELALAMFGILSIFSVLAGALYERRNELGLETRRSPERTAELAREAQRREHHALVTSAR
jgi:hypothetical protein